MAVAMAETAAGSRVEDRLGGVLYGLRALDSCYMRCALSAPWGIRIPACPHPGGTSLHFVAQGRAWLTAAGRSMELGEGDLVLLLHGGESLIADPPDPPKQAVFVVPELSHPLELRHGGGGARALVLSAGAQLGSPDHPLLSLLPAVLHIGRSGDPAGVGGDTPRPGAGVDRRVARPAGSPVARGLRAAICDADRR